MITDVVASSAVNENLATAEEQTVKALSHMLAKPHIVLAIFRKVILVVIGVLILIEI